MDLRYSAEDERFRERVGEFLDRELPEGWQGIGALRGREREEFRVAWREALLREGLIAPGWPKEYGGGGLGPIGQSIVAEEMLRRGAPARPAPNDLFNIDLIGPTIIEWGTGEQKDFFIPRTISGEIAWAQGYSEPEAGSDLFNVRTRAVREGDEWVINGQKVWQSGGLTANWLFVVVRTDPAAERSKGLSFMLVPVDQPGVEIRGIKNLAGEVDFTEVFFNDARTSADCVLGGTNNGAKVALTLLGHERGAGGLAAALAFRIQVNHLVDLIAASGLGGDQQVVERVARCYEEVQALHAVALQMLSDVTAGRTLDTEPSVFKLMASTHHQTVTELAVDVLGLDVLDVPGGEPVEILDPQPLGTDPQDRGLWLSMFLHARAGTIYGGSQEIQRSTIGERALGLPREPRVTIAVTG